MDTPGAGPRRAWGRLLTVAGVGLLAAVLVGIAVRVAGEPRAVAAVPPGLAASPVSTPLTATSPTPTPSGSTAMLPPGQDVLVLGDSLALSTYAWLADLMPDRHVSWEAQVGRTTAEARVALAARAAAGELPPVIVVSSGTNDVDAGTLQREARRILAIAGADRCVVWADVVRPDSFGDGMGAADEALETAWRDHPNVVPVRWTRMVEEHPDWLTSDGVHPVEAGNIARARALAQAVFSCSPLDPDAPVATKDYLPYASFLAPGGGTVPGVGGGTGTAPSAGATRSETPSRSAKAAPTATSSHPVATPPSQPASDTPTPPAPTEPAESGSPVSTGAGTDP